MKKKQLISIIITGAVIIAVGITGIVSNIVMNNFINENVGTTLGSILESNVNAVELPTDDFIGVLNIVGKIESTSNSSFSTANGYNHDMYLDYVDQMENSKTNKGILLYVDTPGGSIYETDELYLKLMEYKKKTKRPIWAYFASQACSGGYYISMAADKIYANRNCWTGSIGVIMSLINYKGLYDKLGIKEIDITSGKNKSMGSSGLELTKEQRSIFKSLIDEQYDQFVEIVAKGRNMDEAKVRELGDGRIYSAKQAKENTLIDEIGSLEDEKKAFTKQLGVKEDITYYEPVNEVGGFLSSIFSEAKKLVPKSDAELATDIVESKGNGVLKYYAK